MKLVFGTLLLLTCGGCASDPLPTYTPQPYVEPDWLVKAREESEKNTLRHEEFMANLEAMRKEGEQRQAVRDLIASEAGTEIKGDEDWSARVLVSKKIIIDKAINPGSVEFQNEEITRYSNRFTAIRIQNYQSNRYGAKELAKWVFLFDEQDRPWQIGCVVGGQVVYNWSPRFGEDIPGQ